MKSLFQQSIVAKDVAEEPVAFSGDGRRVPALGEEGDVGMVDGDFAHAENLPYASTPKHLALAPPQRQSPHRAGEGRDTDLSGGTPGRPRRVPNGMRALRIYCGRMPLMAKRERRLG